MGRVPQFRITQARCNLISILLFACCLAALSFHLYLRPIYDIDSLGYMGNAMLWQDTDPVRIHQRVYQEVRTQLPTTVARHFLGQEPGQSEEQSRSLRDRAINPGHFAEFLPFFAIRPIYNGLLFILNKSGMSFIRASVIVSSASFFILGCFLFLWLREHTSDPIAALATLLTMMCSPIRLIGSYTGADGLSTLCAISALYFIFRSGPKLGLGTGLLLASIWVRTDNIVLVAPVLGVLYLQRRLNLWQAIVLSTVAVASVLAINHFAGDYGLRMLYYRNFVGIPIAPAENPVQFSVHDYLAAFRKGITDASESFLLPFLALGLIGIARSPRGRALAFILVVYAALHFVVLPNWQERWFGVFYIGMAVVALSGAQPEHDPCTPA